MPWCTSPPSRTSTGRSTTRRRSSRRTWSAAAWSSMPAGATTSPRSCTSRPTRCTARSRRVPSPRTTRFARAAPTPRRRPPPTCSPMLVRRHLRVPDHRHPDRPTTSAPTTTRRRSCRGSSRCSSTGGRVPLYGDGGNVREWTYVLDNVAAQWLVLTEGDPRRRSTTSASGEERSNLELTRALLAAVRAVGRGRAGPDRARPGPARARPALRRSTPSRVRALGWDAIGHVRRGARRDRGLVPHAP
jgi:hypothetical protein